MGIFSSHREAPSKGFTGAEQRHREESREKREKVRVPATSQDVRRYLSDTGRGELFQEGNSSYVIEEVLLDDLNAALIEDAVDKEKIGSIRALLLAHSQLREQPLYLDSILRTLDELDREVDASLEDAQRHSPDDVPMHEARKEWITDTKYILQHPATEGKDLDTALSFVEGEFLDRFHRATNSSNWQNAKRRKQFLTALNTFRNVRDAVYFRTLYPYVNIPHYEKHRSSSKKNVA